MLPPWSKLLREKRLVGDMRRIARADFKPKLSANLRKLKDKVVAAYVTAGCNPPDPADFAGSAAGNIADLFEVCVAEGLLVRIAAEIYLHSDVEADMRRRVAEFLHSNPGATVAQIRDLLCTTRKFAVPLCEYLDRIGVSKREGDVRVLANV